MRLAVLLPSLYVSQSALRMGKARHHSFVYFRLFLYTGCIYAGAADYTLIAGRRLTNEPSLEISSRASSSQDVADTGIALRQRSNASTHIKPPTIIPEHERGPRLPRASDRRHKWSVRSHPSGQGIDNGKQAEQQPGSRVLRPFQIRLHYTACYGEGLAYRQLWHLLYQSILCV